jgi:hypothetical protein
MAFSFSDTCDPNGVYFRLTQQGGAETVALGPFGPRCLIGSVDRGCCDLREGSNLLE